MEEVAKVLTFGARKYAPDNWRKLDNLRARYIGAALRHITEELKEPAHKDAESGLDGLAHAICCLMFVLEDRLAPVIKEQNVPVVKQTTSGIDWEKVSEIVFTPGTIMANSITSDKALRN